MNLRLLLLTGLVLFGLGLAILSPVYGQTEETGPEETAEPPAEPRPPAPIRDVRSTSVEQRLQILEEEIERLKLQKGTDKKLESKGGMGPAASGVYHSGGGLTWGGYGEVKYTDYRKSGSTTSLPCLFFRDSQTPTDDGTVQGRRADVEDCLSDYEGARNEPADQFDVHRVILYAGYRFNDWIVLNTEIEYEHADEVFVEFAYVDLEFAPEFQLGLGLHLVPVGITNLMHEPTTFHSVNRPQTERQIIPSTWREGGVMAHGQLFGGAFEYRAGVLNGGRADGNFSESSFIRGGRTKGSQARAENLAGVAALEFKGIDGLTLGASYYEGENGQNEVMEIHPLNRYQFIEDSDSYLGKYESNILSDVSDYAKVRVRLAEGHFVYQGGPVNLRGLFARGWMSEDDARAINANTGNNIGTLVEGGYGEIGIDLLHWSSTEQKLVLFVRNEYLNTQKNTAQYGFQDNLIDNFCKSENVTRCKTFDDLDSGATVGVIEDEIEAAVNSELAKNGETWRFAGRPNPVNDRRIITGGLAYFPHPQVVFKVDYESWWSASTYHKDIQQRNSSNNKIDRVNVGVGWIF